MTRPVSRPCDPAIPDDQRKRQNIRAVFSDQPASRARQESSLYKDESSDDDVLSDDDELVIRRRELWSVRSKYQVRDRISIAASSRAYFAD